MERVIKAFNLMIAFGMVIFSIGVIIALVEFTQEVKGL